MDFILIKVCMKNHFKWIFIFAGKNVDENQKKEMLKSLNQCSKIGTCMHIIYNLYKISFMHKLNLIVTPCIYSSWFRR